MANTFTVRASAALPASGAYDTLASAKAVPVRGARSIELFFDYVRAGAGGAVKFEIWVSRDGTNYYPRTVIDGASNSSGAVNVNTAQLKMEAAPSNASQPMGYIVEGLEQIASLKILAAEYGATGTPGTLAIAGSAGG